MLRRKEIALPKDTDIRALYLPDLRMLCINVCVSPDAKVIVIWHVKRKERDE